MIFDNKVISVGDLLAQKTVTHPTARINYFQKIGEEHSGTFTLKQEQQIVLIPTVRVTLDNGGGVEDDEANAMDAGEDVSLKVIKAVQANCGSLVPHRSWSSSSVAKIVWTVKWQGSGLMPVRPNLLFISSGELQPGFAIEL